MNTKINIKIYRTIILPLVLHGYETWLLTLREERRLRMFNNRVLRKMFGPKRDEVTGKWRKLHKEELNDLYSSPHRYYPGDKIKDKMDKACSTYGRQMCIRGFGGGGGGLREGVHLEDPCVDGSTILECIPKTWSGGRLDTDRCRALVAVVMNCRVPGDAGNFSTS
jgi:hypothetical protein